MRAPPAGTLVTGMAARVDPDHLARRAGDANEPRGKYSIE